MWVLGCVLTTLYSILGIWLAVVVWVPVCGQPQKWTPDFLWMMFDPTLTNDDSARVNKTPNIRSIYIHRILCRFGGMKSESSQSNPWKLFWIEDKLPHLGWTSTSQIFDGRYPKNCWCPYDIWTTTNIIFIQIFQFCLSHVCEQSLISVLHWPPLAKNVHHHSFNDPQLVPSNICIGQHFVQNLTIWINYPVSTILVLFRMSFERMQQFVL